MAFQLVLFAAFVAVASAGVLAPAPLAAPILQAAPIARVAAPLVAQAPVVAHAAVDANYDPNPQYSYAYDVQDGLTGDSKNQQESRSGDVVQGSYSLTDPDGTRRTVEYTADPVNGFNAVVHREPLVAKAVVAAAPVARVAAPVAVAPVARYAAPVARLAPAPLAYSAGLAHAPIAAPLAYSAGIAHAPIAAPLGYAASPYARTIIH